MLLFAAFIQTFTQAGLWFYQPYFQLSGIDLLYFGLIFASFNVVAAGSSKIAYALEAKLGQRQALLLLVLVLSASYFLMGNIIFVFGFGFAFLQQFVRGFARVVLTDYINALTASEVRATVLSVRSLVANLFYAAVLPLLGWLADTYSLLVALNILGLLSLVVCGGLCFW